MLPSERMYKRTILRRTSLPSRRRVKSFRLVEIIYDGDQIDALLFNGDRYEIVEGKDLVNVPLGTIVRSK